MGRLEGLDICYFISQLNKKWISKRRKINENKSEFFEKINQVKKYLARLFFFFLREKIYICNIRNEKDSRTCHGNAKRLIAYYVQLSAHKCDSLEEIEKFFERHTFPNLT